MKRAYLRITETLTKLYKSFKLPLAKNVHLKTDLTQLVFIIFLTDAQSTNYSPIKKSSIRIFL